MECLSGFKYNTELHTCDSIDVGSSITQQTVNAIIGVVGGTFSCILLGSLCFCLYSKYKEALTYPKSVDAEI